MDRSVRPRQLISSILLLLSLSSLLTVCHARTGSAFRTAHHNSCLRLRGGDRVRYEQVISEHDLQFMRTGAAGALRMDQTNPEGWLSLGDVRSMQGEWAEAREVFAEGAKRCPQDLRLRQLAADSQIYYNPGEDDGWSSQPGFEEGELQSFAAEAPAGTGLSGTSELIHASSGPLVPPDACSWLVSCAVASETMKGSVEFPAEAFAPTVHVHISSLPAVVTWFNELFKTTCIPLLRKGFSLSNDECSNLRVIEAIIVRYDATPETGPGKRGLKRHVDAADFLLSISLNGPEDFEGGGMWVDAIESVICGPAGTVIAIDPRLPHAAMAVEKGSRFVLAVYVSRGVNRSGKPRGYTLEGLFKEESPSEKEADGG